MHTYIEGHSIVRRVYESVDNALNLSHEPIFRVDPMRMAIVKIRSKYHAIPHCSSDINNRHQIHSRKRESRMNVEKKA